MNDRHSVRAAIASLELLRRERSSAAFLREFERALTLFSGRNMWDAGKEAIAVAMAAWNDNLFAQDDVFLLIYLLSQFHSSAGEHPVVIGLYIQGAHYFADFRAFQSAYRLLRDAEDYARGYKLLESVLEIKEVVAYIAMIERDYSYAERAFAEVEEILAALGLSVPTRLLANSGTLKMRQGNYSAAADAFRQVIARETNLETRCAASLNYSACLRELDKVDDAKLILAEARLLIDGNTPDEQRIEFDLIEAATAARVDDYDALQRCLLSAVTQIDDLLLSTGRLHFRRGIREGYRQRITELLCKLPTCGQSDEFIRVLAFLKSNAFSDWMAILDWHDQVMLESDVPNELRARLVNVVTALAVAGTPSLYGYREKYDDPWEAHGYSSLSGGASEPGDRGLPWSELNNIIREVVACSDIAYPWHDASSEVLGEQLCVRLESGDSLLAVLSTSRAIHLIVVTDNSYTRSDVPRPEVAEFLRSFDGFRNGRESRNDYMCKLQHCVESLSGRLRIDLDAIAASASERIIILPEAFELPLVACVMTHPALKAKAKNGDLSVILCPVLHGQASIPLEITEVTACFYSEDALGLNREEVHLLSDIVSPTAVRVIPLPSSVDMQTMLSADVVHIVAHGVSIARFADANFASTHPTGTGVNVPDLQSVSWKTPHRVVFINSCFSGNSLNWNIFHDFGTNEQIGIPTTLLLNRRAVVIALSWTTFDVTGFIFARHFYENLIGGLAPERSFTKALADLADMTSEQIRLALGSIQGQDIRAQKQNLFRPGELPFNHPYVSGTFQLYSLL